MLKRACLVTLLIMLTLLAACQGSANVSPPPAASEVPQEAAAAPTGASAATVAAAAAPTEVQMPTVPAPAEAPAITEAPAPTEIPAATAAPPPTEAAAAATAAVPPGAAANTTLLTFKTELFAGAGTCEGCHGALTDASGNDVSITNMWRSSSMANAARDPFWRAKVSSEVQRTPGLQAVIEEKCANCHMPMAEVEAKAAGGQASVFGKGGLDPANPLHEAAVDGVSCTLCHQIQAKGLGAKESFSGGYAIDTAARAPERVVYGQYADPAVPALHAATGFKAVEGKHLAASEMCATCHNLYTPFVDASGKVLGEFPEQTPFTEWQQTPLAGEGTTCVACHMPAAQGEVVISSMPGALPARSPFGLHSMIGGNAQIMDILRDHGQELGVTADVEHFNATRARTLELLASRTATVTLQSLMQSGDQLTAQVKVTVATGHKFPTSFPSRRAWLHVTVSDVAGKAVFESGKPGASGTIAGNAADETADAFEPHYDTISKPDQVQIYEPIMGDNEGKVTYTLLRGGQDLKDNRLLPAGFDKAKVPADIAVYGEAARDVNFVAGGDLVTYQVDVKGAQGPFRVSVELLYQPISYRMAQDLAADRNALTKQFTEYFAAADKMPAVVATAEQTSK